MLIDALPISLLKDAPQLFHHEMVGQTVDARILYQKGAHGEAGVQRSAATRNCRRAPPR